MWESTPWKDGPQEGTPHKRTPRDMYTLPQPTDRATSLSSSHPDINLIQIPPTIPTPLANIHSKHTHSPASNSITSLSNTILSSRSEQSRPIRHSQHASPHACLTQRPRGQTSKQVIHTTYPVHHNIQMSPRLLHTLELQTTASRL